MRQQNYKKDFNGQNIFVGIDVHLKTWSVSVALPGGYLKTHTQKAWNQWGQIPWVNPPNLSP